MEVKIKGIVISETDYLEKDKYIEILTFSHGKLSVFCKNIRTRSSLLQNKTRVFSFCEFTVFTKKDRVFLVDAVVIESFFQISNDVLHFALASYFLQVCKKICIEPDEKPAKTLITCLKTLTKSKHSTTFIKSVFELRIMADTGFLPNISHCYICSATENIESLYFDLLNGSICCGKCMNSNEFAVLANFSVLKAMQHIIYADYNKLFSFNLAPSSLKLLENITENYLKIQSDTTFKTLEFYKMIGE